MTSETKKNILLLIPNLGFGGAQLVFHDHSVELGRHYNVYECVFNKEHGVVYPTSNELIDLQVPGGGHIFRKIYNFYLRCKRVREVKKKYKIDVCISHLEGADYVNILSRNRERQILVIHGSKLHDKEIKGWIGWLQQHFLLPFLYRYADKIVAVSRDIRTELIQEYKLEASKVIAINNFFYPAKVQGKAQEPIEPKFEFLFTTHKTLVTSGRLARQKNQGALLKVFAELIKKQSCKLIMLGDGELRQELVQKASQLNLRVYKEWDADDLQNDYEVYFLGYQQNPFKYIARSNVFVFPSAWEGFPMALCEAMICGAPVVTADCPTGPREILAPESLSGAKTHDAEFAQYGILMPMLEKQNSKNEIEVWATTLQLLLQDEKVLGSYSLAAQQRIKDFTPQKLIKKWIQIIEGLY